jgi:hypothetical protein
MSYVLAVAEVGPAVPWTKPADVPYHPGLPFPKVTWPYANVITFSMLDGVVRSVKPDLGEATWRLLIEREDGHNIPDLKALRPSFPAEAAEEKAILAKTNFENRERIAELEALLKEHTALLKLRNVAQSDLEKARALSEELKRMIDTYKPRIQFERNNLGLRPDAKIPDPKDLIKP